MTIEEIVCTYSNMLYRICIVMLGNEADAQDAVQDTFCKYLERGKDFTDKEHEKAWLITVATNRCRDMQRLRLRHPKVDLEKITASCEAPDYNEVLIELIKLPSSVKSAVYLHYIEGYKLAEVAEMLGITQNAVKKRLQRGRKMLKLRLENYDV